VVRIDEIFTDITARKQMEEALSRSVRELAVRTRIAHLLLNFVDEEMCAPAEEMYTEVLAVILEIMGSRYGIFAYLDEKGDFVAPTLTRTVWDACQIPDKQFVFPRASWGDSSWPTAIREKRTILRNEPSTQTPEGHIRISRHISMPLIHQGGVVGLVEVANKEQDYTPADVTLLETIGGLISPVLNARLARQRRDESLKEALGDLRRSNKELEQFACVASHDMQEPLRMVSSYTQLLARRYGDRLDQDAMEFIGFAVDGANRMQQLIRDLLVYSRVTTRGSPFVPVDLCEALGKAVANLQTAINESAAMVTNGDLPTLNADHAQMVQVFQNLIGNAIKFRKKDEPPRVHVSAERADGEWIISVKDNGIGIDPQYFDRVFVIFQQLHRKQEYPGTGIGLALCERIAKRHEGRIWVESSPGDGATFHFTIKA
jgi:signal transduction histidine kinase